MSAPDNSAGESLRLLAEPDSDVALLLTAEDLELLKAFGTMSPWAKWKFLDMGREYARTWPRRTEAVLRLVAGGAP